MWHRWYSANVGSFRSIDPLWPRESAYGYADGVPHGWIDPLGTRPATPRIIGLPDCQPVPQFPPYGDLCQELYREDLDDCLNGNWWRRIGKYAPWRIAYCLHKARARRLSCEFCCDAHGANEDGLLSVRLDSSMYHSPNDVAVCTCFGSDRDDLSEFLRSYIQRTGSAWPVPSLSLCDSITIEGYLDPYD